MCKGVKTCEKPIIYNKTLTNDKIEAWPQGRFYYETWLSTGDICNLNGCIYNLLEHNYRGLTRKEVITSLIYLR